MQRRYFDHNATTPLDERVLDAMLPYYRDAYGNASSLHAFGQRARQGVELARRQVAAQLDCDSRDIVFTSGGTEADNLAVFGVGRGSGRRHVVTTTIEHPAVLQACQHLVSEGVEVTYVGVGSDGVIAPEDIRGALRPDTVLISVMHASNETGSVQPIAEIGQIAHEAGALFHVDGVQAFGKLQSSVADMHVDLYSLSAHKIYGPKGAGALYVRRGVQLEKVQHGGSHERDRRAGTENVAGIVGLGAAAELAGKTRQEEAQRVGELRDRLEREVQARISSAHVHCADAERLPTTTSLRLDGADAEPMLISLDLHGFAVSSGAACSSGSAKPSHVLTAIGLSKEQARSTLRFSLGRRTDKSQIDALLDVLPGIVDRLRALAPVPSNAN